MEHLYYAYAASLSNQLVPSKLVMIIDVPTLLYRVSTWLPSPGQRVPTTPKSLKTSEPLVRSFTGSTKTLFHRLNMEIDLQSLFWLYAHSCSHWLRHRNSPLHPHLDSYTRALLVSQDSRHLFVTPCVAWTKIRLITSTFGKITRKG